MLRKDYSDFMNRLRSMSMEKYFISYTFYHISNCHMSIVHVFLTADLKQAESHLMSMLLLLLWGPTLCDPIDCSHQAPPSMGFFQARVHSVAISLDPNTAKLRLICLQNKSVSWLYRFLQTGWGGTLQKESRLISQQVPQGQENHAQGLLSGFVWVDFSVPQILRSCPIPEDSLSHSFESMLRT